MSYLIETQRIGFKQWDNSQAELATQLWGGNAEVTKFIHKNGAFSPAEIKQRLATEIKSMELHNVQYWPLFLKATNEFVGVCGLRMEGTTGSYELGYHLLPAFWGQGIGTEVARRVVNYAFEELNAVKLVARHHPENQGSKKIILKLGFVFKGFQYYQPTGLQHPHYELTRTDYLGTLK
nr:GNAT family N-acetyltransferase [Liquorilactobacillus satsumensis]